MSIVILVRSIGMRFWGDSKPVVLARGLWENLLAWDDFGKELTLDQESPRDAWLIELTGGPTIDGDCLPSGQYDCPNYNYEDLVDYYWPALIAGVQEYTGEDNIDYVGFSNGCRVGLDSLKNWSEGKNNAGYYFDYDTGEYVYSDLSANPVNSFVAVGCPGAFEGNSPVAQVISDFGDEIEESLSGKEHISSKEFGQAMLGQCGRYSSIFDPIKKRSCEISAHGFSGNSKISYNLTKKYKEWIESRNDSQPGNVTLNNFMMVYGKLPFFNNLLAPGNSDGLVTGNDAIAIFNKVVVTNEKRDILLIKNVEHVGRNSDNSLPDHKKTREEIKKFLTEVE